MRDFFHYSLWVALSALFSLAVVNLAPVAVNLSRDYLTGTPVGRLSYQLTAVEEVGAAITNELLPRLVDPIFIPPPVGKVIRADLQAMKLSLYENGAPVAVYDIKSRGRPGTPWETPTGEYRILLKKDKHFSSFGEVWMPWSLQFFGNYFIHGWPYDQHGQPVPEGYSGGCIRLATEDAAAVYDFADLGTMVSIYSDTNSQSSSWSYQLLSSGEPRVKAEAYAAIDLETGEVILERNADQSYAIASLTKLLTGLISLEIVNQYQTVTVSAEAVATYGAQGNLTAGEKLPAGELLFPLLLESSNDAAEALARHFGREQFIKELNNKAAAIGLSRTILADPSGLSPDNISTAKDLARLTKHLYQSKSYLLNITTGLEHRYGHHLWRNNNKLTGMEGYRGGKNGYTDAAGQTQIAVFDLPLA
jgi:hypothetical protein